MQEATLLSKAGVDDYCEDQPFQYQDFSIKNTFVHGFIYGRPPSLEACHERRRSTSCPPGASPKNECLKEEDFCADSCSRFTHEGPAGRPFSSRTTSCSFEGASSAPSDPGEGSDIFLSAPHFIADVSEEAILQAQEALAAGQPLPAGAVDMQLLGLPTRGSVGHSLGRCRPCAFVHTKGCGAGFNCQFCHLCEPDAKKNRKRRKASKKGHSASAAQHQPVRVCLASLLEAEGAG
mmetsp:Transcript_148426/g.261980  ORF Transcript_148426/g.261980 Transcript_148426/m.261980 type:complete len:235 (-) Transcript_148426:169-873(-)